MPRYSDLFKKAWPLILENIGLYVGLTILFVGFNILLSSLPVISSLLWAPLTFGYLRAVDRLAKGEGLEFTDIFWGYLDLNRALQGIFLSFILNLGIIFGTLLLVVPGVWFFLRTFTSHVNFALIPGTLGEAINSLKRSFEQTRERAWWMLGYILMCGAILFLGIFALGVGVLVAIPLVALTTIHLTQELDGPVVSPMSQGSAGGDTAAEGSFISIQPKSE